MSVDPEHAGGAAGISRPNSVEELIAYAKANPGKVNFGSQGVGTTPHLTGELFARVTGTQLAHVPYRGTAQAVNDSIAGHVDLLFFQINSVREQYQAEEGEDAGGDDRRARRLGAGGADHGRGRREGLSLRHLERARRAAEDAGGDRRQAQCRASTRCSRTPETARAPAHA